MAQPGKFVRRTFHMLATPFRRFCVMYVVALRRIGVRQPQLGLLFRFGCQRTIRSFSLVCTVLVVLNHDTYYLYVIEGWTMNIFRALAQALDAGIQTSVGRQQATLSGDPAANLNGVIDQPKWSPPICYVPLHGSTAYLPRHHATRMSCMGLLYQPKW